MSDKLYMERANGLYEAWTYSEGERVYVIRSPQLAAVEAYAREHSYELVRIPTNYCRRCGGEVIRTQEWRHSRCWR